MESEFYRKLIHLGTLVAPMLVWFLPRPGGLVLLGAALALALIIEFSRARSVRFRSWFLRYTHGLLRGHERGGISGATYLALAYFLSFLIFPRPVAVLAMLYGGGADAVAALAGRRWGRHRTSWGKSWEGAGAAFGFALAAGLLIPGMPVAAALPGALAAAAFEFLPLPGDDNVRVSLGGGAVLWAVLLIL